jgi:hypothetical protein
MNKHQAGVMKILGKIDPRVWTILWHMAATANERGISKMGRVDLVWRTGWSSFMVEKWMQRAAEMGWWREFSQMIPVETIGISNGPAFTQRKVVYKLMAGEVVQGKIVPGNRHYPSNINLPVAVFRRVMRKKFYDQIMVNKQYWEKKMPP